MIVGLQLERTCLNHRLAQNFIVFVRFALVLLLYGSVTFGMESPNKDYDYSKSSEENHSSDEEEFVGKYADIRIQLDYSYHKHYTPERQLLHDRLIDSLDHTHITDKDKGVTCQTPADHHWMVFTAGSMGVGKGHVMRWLDKEGLFPLSSFVLVDPDIIRKLLPESARYHDLDPDTAGYLTQKEVGYISEVLTLHALLEFKNVLVDGSLRDGEWYHTYLTDLTRRFPFLRIGIIHVTARLETILYRVARRAEEEGRSVPEKAVKDAMEKIPQSIKTLSHFMYMYACFTNEHDNAPPACRRLWIKGKSGRSLSMDLSSQRDSLASARGAGGGGGGISGGVGGGSRCDEVFKGIDEDGVINSARSSTGRAATTTTTTPDAAVAVFEPSASRPSSLSYNFSPYRRAMFGSLPFHEDEPPIHLDMEHYNEVINERQSMKLGQQEQPPLSAYGLWNSNSPHKVLTSSSTNCIGNSSSSSAASVDVNGKASRPPSASAGASGKVSRPASASASASAGGKISRPPSAGTTAGRDRKVSRDNKESTPELGTSGLSAEEEFNAWAADFKEMFAQSCAV